MAQATDSIRKFTNGRNWSWTLKVREVAGDVDGPRFLVEVLEESSNTFVQGEVVISSTLVWTKQLDADQQMELATLKSMEKTLIGTTAAWKYTFTSYEWPDNMNFDQKKREMERRIHDLCNPRIGF